METVKKVALVVIDMQNDFIDGALKNEEAIAIIDNVANMVKTARKVGIPVIFTRDTHYEDYMETVEGKHLPVLHCIKDTEGWQISSKIEVLESDKIIDKPTFGSLELADYLATLDVDEIEIIGVCTDICVISNAMIIKAKCPEKEIFVNESCCAGITPESHKNAIEAMKMCHINVHSNNNELD